MTTQVALALNRLQAILEANVLAGTKVFRDRADAQSREETPCINLVTVDAPSEAFSDDTDKRELLVELRINIRDDDPVIKAEAQHEAVHAAIVTDATLKALCVSCRQLGPRYDREEADATALIKAAPYRFVFPLTPINTL